MCLRAPPVSSCRASRHRLAYQPGARPPAGSPRGDVSGREQTCRRTVQRKHPGIRKGFHALEVRVRIDPDKAWRTIREASRSDASVSTKMSHVIDVCAAAFPHPDWKRLALLPFDKDVESLATWIPSVLRREPPTICI